jgi:hypothetical protein
MTMPYSEEVVYRDLGISVPETLTFCFEVEESQVVTYKAGEPSSARTAMTI